LDSIAIILTVSGSLILILLAVIGFFGKYLIGKLDGFDKGIGKININMVALDKDVKISLEHYRELSKKVDINTELIRSQKHKSSNIENIAKQAVDNWDKLDEHFSEEIISIRERIAIVENKIKEAS
jgi:hypothetical protein